MKYISALIILISVTSNAESIQALIPVQHVFTKDQMIRATNAQTLPSPSGPPYLVFGANNPSVADCLKTACEMAGEFGCDSDERRLQMMASCRGSQGDFCLKETCASLGRLSCDEYSEVQQILNRCGSGSNL